MITAEYSVCNRNIFNLYLGTDFKMDINSDEVGFSSQDGGEMLDSTRSVGHTNFGLGTNKMHQASISRHGKHYPGDGRNQFQFSTNGHQRQSPRALIDAYGSDKRVETSSNKLLVEPLDINGIDNKVVSTPWQNTEEEEFNWEDMSPTLVEHKRSNGILPPSIILSRERSSGIAADHAAALGQDTRSGWVGQSLLPPVNDPSIIAEDAFVRSGVCFLYISVMALFLIDAS